MKYIYLFIVLLIVSLTTNAQINYSFTNTRINNSTYTDIAASGTTIPMTGLENGSSASPQNIGFNFSFNGTSFTQVMIHADGILKFGTEAPGASTAISPSPATSYTSVMTSTAPAFQNIVLPFFCDLVQGTALPEYHIITTGTAPNRITTIQWKNLRDADNAGSTLQHQFENMEFQIRLYESTNNIEIVYGNLQISSNIPLGRFSSIGIKNTSSNFISYTKANSNFPLNNALFVDPAYASNRTNANHFVFRNTTSVFTTGTTHSYFAQLPNDINVARLFVDDAVPQTPTIGKNIQALIKNEGALAATNIPVTLTLSGANSNTETIIIANLAAGASQLVSFTPLVASAKGLQNVSIATNPTTDDRAANNSLQTSQTVTQNLVKLYSNDKKTLNGFGFNGGTGMVGTKIFGAGTRNISQLRLSFVTNNVLVDVRIYEDGGVGNTPSATALFTSAILRTSNANELIIPVPAGIAVTDDYYIVVAQRETTNMGLNFYEEYPRMALKTFNAVLNGTSWTESTTSFNALLTAVQETNLVDVGFEAITAPLCSQTNNEEVKATIRNFSTSIHDYATNPVTVTGFVKDEVTNTTVPFNFIKNTGTIAAGGRDTVTLLTSFNFTSKGNYVFVAKTICTSDLEAQNDSLSFSIFTKITFSGVPLDSICPNTSLTLSIASPYLRAPLNFISASDGTISFPTPTLNVKPIATTTYYASGVDYRGCTLFDSVIVKVKSLGVPAAPVISTVDSVLSYKNDFSVVLTAPELAGHTITWQSSATGGVATNGGSTYTFSLTSAFGQNETHKAFYTRIADGCSSTFSNTITTSYAIGLLISNSLTTICDTSFYDSGGPSLGHNNTNFTRTYTPTDGSKKLKLTINKFSLAQFGSIFVYDGPDVFSPRLTTITSTTSTDNKIEFVASNPTGVLTVRFTAGGFATGFIGGFLCQTPLQFRSTTNGIFTNRNIWESRQVGDVSFSPATRAPNKGDDTIWVIHNVNINSSIALDQLVVEPSGNMQLSGASTNLSLYKTIPENELTIKGSFSINSGTFFGSNTPNIVLLGTVINNGSIQTDSVQVFENSTPAIFSGNATISKLIVNSSQGLAVNGNLEIQRTLSLQNGIVAVNAANYINLVSGFGPTIEGGNANSYVEGRFRRQEFITSDPIVFPLGVNGLYRPISLLANQSSFDFGVEYEAKLILGAATSRTLPATLTALNNRYYHNITITNGQGNFINASVIINYDNGDGITDAANLGIAKDDGGSNWVDIGGSGSANGVGFITSNLFTSFSDFVLANKLGGGNVLPLRFLSFTGNILNNTSVLDWRTDNEINTARFIVQRSNNAVTFSDIGTVASLNTSGINGYRFIDNNPLKDINFYRIKQIDIDGRFTYSAIVKLNYENTNTLSKMTIYPNPATNFIFVKIPDNKKLLLQIFDAQGKQIISQNVTNQSTVQIDVTSLAKGNYVIRVSDGKDLYSRNFIKL